MTRKRAKPRTSAAGDGRVPAGRRKDARPRRDRYLPRTWRRANWSRPRLCRACDSAESETRSNSESGIIRSFRRRAQVTAILITGYTEAETGGIKPRRNEHYFSCNSQRLYYRRSPGVEKKKFPGNPPAKRISPFSFRIAFRMPFARAYRNGFVYRTIMRTDEY